MKKTPKKKQQNKKKTFKLVVSKKGGKHKTPFWLNLLSTILILLALVSVYSFITENKKGPTFEYEK